MKKIQVSAKNVEKAIEQGLQELGVSQDDVEIKILDEGGFFRKAKVELICDTLEEEKEEPKKEVEKNNKTEKKALKEEKKQEKKETKAEQKEEKKQPNKTEKVKDENETKLAEFGKDFLLKLCEKMNVEAEIDYVETENGIVFNATGEKVNKLIGKRGEALNAIQTILSNVTRNKGFREKVFFDVENYKNRREITLVSLAEKMAKKAVKIQKPVKLERMSAYERKIIHTALQEFEGVETRSEGNEPNRCLIIFPTKD